MKIHIGKSKSHGKGIFTIRDIKKGEVVFTIEGKKVRFLINNKKQAEIAKMNWVGYGKNTWIDPISFSVYLNHSCNSSSFIKGKKEVIARRDINKGEEITIDYSLNEGDIFWHMQCHCGSKNCRKNIRSIQFLSKEFFNKNKIYIPKYYQEVFKNFNIRKFKNQEELRMAWVGFIKRDFRV